MRRRIAPSMAVSLVALFFSLTGAGLAADRYLITSTSQIAPSVQTTLEQQIIRGLEKGHVYYVNSREVALPPGSPGTTVGVACHRGDVLLAGSYSGVGEVVTVDEPNSVGWIVSAQPAVPRDGAEFIAQATCLRG